MKDRGAPAPPVIAVMAAAFGLLHSTGAADSFSITGALCKAELAHRRSKEKEMN